MIKIGVVSLFPELFHALSYGITGRALQQQLLQVELRNPRDFSPDPHRSVDDRPYGGGPGMVMQVQPLRDAMLSLKASIGDRSPVICLSPQGKQINQQLINSVAKSESLIMIAGRYEGIDERFVARYVDEEWSLGDYVISGGEFAALIVIDAVARLLPGALGHEQSAEQDSFMTGLLDHPHYTRPEIFEGQETPAVLLGGNHATIETWRLKQALGRTWIRRPDLLAHRALSEREQQLLNEFISELGAKHE